MPHWIRVRDTTTGHQFDVEKRSLRHGLEPLNDDRYPDLIGPLARPRPAKSFVGKDGKPAVPGAVVVDITQPGEAVVAAPDSHGPSPESSPEPPDADKAPAKTTKTTAAKPSTEEGAAR